METKKENQINDIYNALKTGEPNGNPLELAQKAIERAYPNVRSDNSEAWKALTNKALIKDFYTDFVTSDIAEKKGVELDKAKDEALKALHTFFASMKGNPNEGGTNAFNIYLKEIENADTKDDFQCSLFPATVHKDGTIKPLNFPKSTLSIIAGRPSAGKTTALVSMAMDALRRTEKKVLFITTEETPQQLFTRFIKNQFCNNCLEQSKGNLLSHNYSKSYINDTFKDIVKTAYKSERESLQRFSKQPTDEFKRLVIESAKQVENFVTCGRLQLFNLDKTENFDELKDELQEKERHTIVILDYIQNLPYAPKATVDGEPISKGDRLEQLRQSIYAINSIVKKNELIGIAGAQFNRQEANEYNPAELELNKLGDSGEIERKAHIAIGLGRKLSDNSKTYYYRVMKDREGETSTHFAIEDYYPYSYARAKIQDNELVKVSLATPKKSRENNDNTPETKKNPNTIKKGQAILSVGAWDNE